MDTVKDMTYNINLEKRLTKSIKKNLKEFFPDTNIEAIFTSFKNNGIGVLKTSFSGPDRDTEAYFHGFPQKGAFKPNGIRITYDYNGMKGTVDFKRDDKRFIPTDKNKFERFLRTGFRIDSKRKTEILDLINKGIKEYIKEAVHDKYGRNERINARGEGSGLCHEEKIIDKENNKMLMEEILDLRDSVITESFSSKIDRSIEKVEKALKKAEKSANSSKAQKDPKVKAGAKKIIKALENKKKELLKLKDDQESAEAEEKKAKTDAEKRKAKVKKLRAEKAFKEADRARDPVMKICKVLSTATGIAAVVGLFFAASRADSLFALADDLHYYLDGGAEIGETRSIGRGYNIKKGFEYAGRAIKDGMNYSDKYHYFGTR